MLKINAVSLAETLEGYPDLFVIALLGGGICSEEEEEEEEEEGGGRDGTRRRMGIAVINIPRWGGGRTR